MEFAFVNEFTSEDVGPVQPASQRRCKRKIEAVSEPAEHGGQTSSKAVKKAKTRQGARNKLAVFENSDDDKQPQALVLSARAYLHLETTSQQLLLRKALSVTHSYSQSTLHSMHLFRLSPMLQRLQQ
jgi:hypothetical protein